MPNTFSPNAPCAILCGIATHQQAKGDIIEHQQHFLAIHNGFNDYQGNKNPKTAVTILSKQAWETACQEANADLDWTARRAQLLVDQIEFSEACVGKRLKIGQVILQITRETDPCQLMDKLHFGLKQALTPDWRGGARCEVIQAGTIQIGDSVEWLD